MHALAYMPETIGEKKGWNRLDMAATVPMRVLILLKIYLLLCVTSVSMVFTSMH